MRRRNSVTSLLTTCFLAAGFLASAPMADAASAKKKYTRKPGESARSYALESRRYRRGPRIPLPIGPSYIYYDYPYYYSRGYYPTHIGGYVYYPYNYYSPGYYRRAGSHRRHKAR